MTDEDDGPGQVRRIGAWPDGSKSGQLAHKRCTGDSFAATDRTAILAARIALAVAQLRTIYWQSEANQAQQDQTPRASPMHRTGHLDTVAPVVALISDSISTPAHPGVISPTACAETGPFLAVRPGDANVVGPPESAAFLAESSSEFDVLRQRRRQLAITIRQRIETRLAGRIRDLSVRFSGQTLLLEGRCATYYTKQLAQHAALALLDDEQLENAIVVAVPR